MNMQNHLFTKLRGKPGYSGFRGVLAAMLLGVLLFASGAKATGLSGTYTIDASGSGNYTTFKAAVSDLNNYGVSGAVVFNVTATTYSETVSVPSVTGASASNTITFHGQGRGNTILSSSGSTVAVKAYTIFDGMGIVSTGSGSTVFNASNSQSCSVTNCNITGAVGTSGYNIYCPSQNSFTVYNCQCYGGGYCLYTSGSVNSGNSTYGLLRCTHNRFSNFSGGSYGMYDLETYKDSIAFNTFDSSISPSSMAYMLLTEECCGFVWWGNKCYASSEDGMLFVEQDYYQISGHPTQSYNCNNWYIITNNSSSNYLGIIEEEEDDANYTFANNTIYNYGALDYPIEFIGYATTNIVFANNIFYNTFSSTIYAVLIEFESGTTVKLFDGNDIYWSAGGGPYFYNGSTSVVYSTYSAYKSAMNAQGWELSGTNVAPPFVNLNYPADLHMSTSKAAPKGVADGIKTDIDGKGRFPTPTAGACESYYGVVNNNAGVTAVISPVASCPGSATVTVQVSNLGLNAITGGTIAWTWNGAAQTAVAYTTPIALYGTTTVTLGTVTLVSGVANVLKAWPTQTNGIANAGGPNDTLNAPGILAALQAGVYTIDGTKATGGKNFKSFTAAVTALNAGVCGGGVVFNVSAATYTEAVAVGPTFGASASNTITFNGSGRTKTTLTSSGATLTLTGSSYVTFNNMTISTTSTSASDVTDGNTKKCRFISDNLTMPLYSSNGSGSVLKSASSTGLVVSACRFNGGYYSLTVSGTGDSILHNRFINGGYTPLYCSGTTGNVYQYNVVDSMADASPYQGLYSSAESGATYDGNYFNFRTAAGVPVYASYSPLYLYQPNSSATFVGSSTTPMPYVFTNNIFQGSGEYGWYIYAYQNHGPLVFAFNTISVLAPASGTCYYGILGEWYYNNSSNSNSPDIFLNNIISIAGAIDYDLYDYEYSQFFASGISNWDNGDTLKDGNDYIINSAGASAAVYTYSGTMSLATYLGSYCPGLNYERHGYNSVVPNFLNPLGNLYLDTTHSAPTGVPFCTPGSNSYISFAGVNHDITGRARCLGFPTIGAYEDPFGKAPKATKVFVPTSGVYPGSPATIYQSHVTGDPATYVWYIINGNYSTFHAISTSVDLYYSGWTLGSNTVKLVTQSCNGADSATVVFNVAAPTAVPVTDFIASANTIQQNTSVLFTDLSTNGPTKWLWQITPDSITVGTTKMPTTTQYNNNLNTTQNPSVLFYYPGFYQVCLTAYNGLGKGATDCKPNYIQVVPATNLGSTAQTVTTSTGYIFDNGGPANPYASIGAPYIQQVLIQPCADSIYLTFSQFDTKCGTDFVKLFNGPTSASPQLGKCSSAALVGNGYGPGFNGGPTNVGCASYCIPNVNRPDTFKAGKTMLLTMDCYTGGAPGFAAYYWVKPSTDKKVVPSFRTASGSDSVCANQLVAYTNTTTINPADPPSFEWDLNGDIADGFECVGVCGTQGGPVVSYPYFLPGVVPITLIAINCGGADTFVQNITVISPPKPVAGFSASILAPTTTDVDVLTSTTVQCVDDYKWTITASAGSVGGAAPLFVNGTSNTSASPNLTFNDTGYYDVTLYVDNAAATQSNTITRTRYIHVRNPYCQPAVAQLSSGIGIYQVVFNTINNYTQPQAAQGYYDFTQNAALSTNIAVGASYNLTVARDAKSIYSPINRDAYIDWNEDGYFTGAGENVLKDSNSTSQSYTAKVVVPTSAKIGATVLRIATNLYLYPNVPCGPNQFGEFQDYRIYVTPYNIVPVITLTGVSTLQDTIVVEQGYPYTEPGYAASSYLYGDITKSVVVTSKIVGGSSAYNNLVPGTYVFSYNVSDAATPPNKAVTKYRVVRITPDKTPPALVVNGPDTVYFEVSKTPYGPLSKLYPSVKSAYDLVDGNLAGSVFIDTSLVQTTVVGVYPVTYTSQDISGNKSITRRYIDVIDTIRPVLTLNPTNPMNQEVYVPFVDPGVTITIPNGYLTVASVKRYLHTTSNVDDSLLGTYKVTYTLTDTFGNVAKPVTRIVNVVDQIAPVLTLIGPSHDSVEVLNTYVDRGYNVSDNYTKTASIKITTSGTFVTKFSKNYANALGGGRDSIIPPYSGAAALGIDYRLTYTATDLSGNSSSATRFIEVYDNVNPTITLSGPEDVNVCRWFPYVDLGYTVSDNFSDSAHIKVYQSGSFLTQGTNLGNQTVSLTYVARDQAGNTSAPTTRNIYVEPSGAFGCTSGIEPGLGLDKYISIFPNPSTGIFNINANLPTEQNVRMSVVNMLGQEMMVIHDGSLSNNNFRVDMSNQASGVYFLKIVTNNQTLTKRIEVAK